MDFLRRGVTIACLKGRGTVFSDMQRLSRVVIGGSRASRQSLRRKVGRGSRAQEELEQERIMERTSIGEVGEKEVRRGGGEEGGRCMG